MLLNASYAIVMLLICFLYWLWFSSIRSSSAAM